MVESEKRAPRQKYKRRKVEPMPATVQTAVDRGRAFQHWLDSNDYFMSDFVKDSGISRAALSAYVSGELDIASMRQDTAERLLRTMGLSDTEAWQFFNIPEEGVTLELERKFPLSVQACQVDVQICPDRCQF